MFVGIFPNEHTNGNEKKIYFGHLPKAVIREMLEGVI